MTAETPQLRPKEMALCQSIAAVTKRTLSQWLERAPSYDVSWGEQKKESSWSPALSIIPITKMSTYHTNVTVLQKLRFKESEDDVLVLYKAITPRDDTVIVTGLEVGVLVDAVAPRGFKVDAEGLSRLVNNEDQTFQRLETPLDAVIRKEFANKEKSKLAQAYNQLAHSSEYLPSIRMAVRSELIIKSPRSLLIVPYHDRTMVVVASCACPPNGSKRKITLDKGTVNYEVGAPSAQILQTAVNLVGQLSRLVKEYLCDYPVSVTFEGIGGILSLYLMLEAGRRRFKPDDSVFTLGEVFGFEAADRIDDLMGLIKGASTGN